MYVLWFHHALDVMDQPNTATHLRVAGVKEKNSQHMYQEPVESRVIL